ncbi:TPA: SDR family NAD(P)-dependent oxidoreductase [Streptococcus agalactiae]
MARTILITGASGGLAQAIINQLPQDDHLIVTGRSREKLEKLYGKRPNTLCLSLDIINDTAVTNTIEKIYGEFGQIDILINNAGFGSFKEFWDYSDEEVKDMFAVNTFATMSIARQIGHKMSLVKSGHIVNIASMAGLIATSKASVYGGSKFAVVGFSNALRLELAEKNVYVTSVNPGPLKTGFFAQADPSGDYLASIGRFALTPEKVAKKVVSILGKNKRELNLPFILAFAHKCYSLFPKTADYFARKVFNYK